MVACHTISCNTIHVMQYPAILMVCFSFPRPSKKTNIFRIYWTLAENMFRLVALCTYNHKSYYKQSNWLRTTHFHSKKNESSSLNSQTGVMAQAGKLSLTHQKSCAHPHVSNCATTSIDEWIMTHRFTSIIYHI